MEYCLSILWYIASILIIYSGIKYTFKYKFLQLNIKKMIIAIKSKSKNEISPLGSLCISLAAKIGVGSLSGIALAIYFGGIGTIFWIVIISLIVAINTYVECNLGIKYRVGYLGGANYYIKNGLNKKYLSYLYSVLLFITYSILFTSIQTNTIISTTNYFNINGNYVTILIVVVIFLIIINGLKGISKINSIIVFIMLIFYFLLGFNIFINNYANIPGIIVNVIKDACEIKSIIPVFLIGMQRAIFITESSIGTSAISASSCDNDASKQGMLEILGIYITVFIVSLTTFLIIVTSDYNLVGIDVKSGIDLVLYAFNYHFGNVGTIFLAIITILFAFSTIISSYYFGETNIMFFINKQKIKDLFKLFFVLIIVLSSFFKSLILWNITDYLLAFLAIINTYAMLKLD